MHRSHTSLTVHVHAPLVPGTHRKTVITVSECQLFTQRAMEEAAEKAEKGSLEEDQTEAMAFLASLDAATTVYHDEWSEVR